MLETRRVTIYQLGDGVELKSGFAKTVYGMRQFIDILDHSQALSHRFWMDIEKPSDRILFVDEDDGNTIRVSDDL